MSLQSDTELRDLVSQTLENAGVLAKIRAELRASVFLVLEEHEAFKGRNLSYSNKPLKDFLSTRDGIVIVNLIREFLQFFGLEFTASVFDPEIQVGVDLEFIGRNKLANDLKLNSGTASPLIAQFMQDSTVSVPAMTVPAHRDDTAQKNTKKERSKEEKKTQEINFNNIKTDSSTVNGNGLIKPTETVIKETSQKPENMSPPSFHNHTKKHDSLRLDLNQINLKATGSSLSSLGTLPPLGVLQSNRTTKTSDKSAKQVSSDIKALLSLGSDSPEHNYEEDFQPSGSERTSKGTNRSSGSGSEIEEETSVGNDDSGSNGSGKTSAGL